MFLETFLLSQGISAFGEIHLLLSLPECLAGCILRGQCTADSTGLLCTQVKRDELAPGVLAQLQSTRIVPWIKDKR